MSGNLSEDVLKIVNDNEQVDTVRISSILGEDHQKVVGIVKSLQVLDDLVVVEPLTHTQWILTAEGAEVAKNGSYEVLIFNAVPSGGIAQAELMKTVPNAKIGFSKAMSKGWISIDKSTNTVVRKVEVDSVEDEVQRHLQQLNANEDSIPAKCKQDYSKRKLIREVITKSFLLKKGSKFSTSISKLETELTPEMIADGSWKNVKFKAYNFDALGQISQSGNLHPVMKVRSEFRQIFLEMGFTEMPTNNYVENSFWNFDALFQPQQHPARDAHDTFFLKDPSTSDDMPSEYLQKVKTVHSEGGYGSVGYKYNWSVDEARKNLLRTHTTAVSARMLYKLVDGREFKPVKYFSIDRVFRNETLDATHLAEFFQVEGVVADYNLTLGNLIGILHEFFKKLGIEELKFKPAYNPYTEPSMEIFCYHRGLQKWIEVGNSGMFRPEMLLPMGLPKNVNVIAWGLSLERPTMVKYGINNIRDMVGPKINLQIVNDSPICRF
ncbi:phenylalanine--tRNA ligase alpha subunit [Planococcus citri]|uniref:phenylalanine--tRNA ligase alpha subunit n=1 Tax=Planococcus citri TaxID=170843 RepID=UPI0031F8F98F